ncbi:DUF58 domain-containing protein [Streptosporangium soli]|nr:DUF58 domain-containing protein [Streptosporangium sp. KLBMP 9127]
MITKTGWGTLAAAALLYGAGGPLGFRFAAVLAAGAAAAVAASLLWTLGRPRLAVRREITPVKVTRGEAAIAMLNVRNLGRMARGGLRAEDACLGTPLAVEVPRLPRGATRTVSYRLPTRRRGEIAVGPLRLSRGDPFGLARRTTQYGGADTLLVRPRTVPLDLLSAGRSRHLEGVSTGAAPSGTVAFHTLREYVIGDDMRHVHWRSSARTGVLMVKQLVDISLPHTTVAFDTRPGAYEGDDDFELAVDAAASAACSAARRHYPVHLLTGAGTLLTTKGSPAEAEEVLDRLALVEREPDARPPLDIVRRAPAGGSLVLVSGARDALAQAASLRRRFDRVVCVWVQAAEDGPRLAIADVSVVEIADLDDLRAGWPR